MSQSTLFKHYPQIQIDSSYYYNSIICQDLLLKNNYTSIFEIPTLEKIVLNTTSSAICNRSKKFNS